MIISPSAMKNDHVCDVFWRLIGGGFRQAHPSISTGSPQADSGRYNAIPVACLALMVMELFRSRARLHPSFFIPHPPGPSLSKAHQASNRILDPATLA